VGSTSLAAYSICLNPSVQSASHRVRKRWVKPDGALIPSPLRCDGKRHSKAPMIAYSNRKDTKRAPTAVLNVTRVRNARLPTRREPQGNGVLVVVSGRESRLPGEGGQARPAEGRTWETVRCG
jgi:hypothetical protein